MRNYGNNALTNLSLPKDLQRLEAESIYIFREVAAEFRKPVLLYSIGKDSSVLLHLARKAFFPSTLPFPLLHIDTTWKFREMIGFRDETAAQLGLDLIAHVNRDGLAQGITPFTHGSSFYTHVMKTEALKQALTNMASTPRLAARGVTKRGAAPRNAYSHSARLIMSGIRGTSGRSCGTSIIAALPRAN